MAKPVLISGIQPTGRLHLGNYLGALKNFVELQNSGKYQCFFFIADYHSLTIDFDPEQKQKEVLGVANAYLTAGINPKKSLIFIQSQVPESTELTWILNNLAPIGELSRMTQFKDKTNIIGLMDTAKSMAIGALEKNESMFERAAELLAKDIKEFEEVYIGLLDYPVLMAADILLYDAKFVPVGEDQLQHLELTRTLARKFNNKFGKVFIEPQAIINKTSRIMSLNDPYKKMSKSQPEGCLFLDNSPKEIEVKIKRAVTDSGSEVKLDKQNKSGVSNLLIIYEALSGIPISKLEYKYRGKGYGEFKADLTKVAIEKLTPFRKRKTSASKLKTILDYGADKACGIACKKMGVVKKKLGLIKRL